MKRKRTYQIRVRPCLMKVRGSRRQVRRRGYLRKKRTDYKRK